MLDNGPQTLLDLCVRRCIWKFTRISGRTVSFKIDPDIKYEKGGHRSTINLSYVKRAELWAKWEWSFHV
jgi:hypothetical protein